MTDERIAEAYEDEDHVPLSVDLLVPPGEILKEELDARGWTQKDLATILDRPEQAISEIIKGTKQITPATALELGGALGTSAETWINLEAQYRLALARDARPSDEISERARLYGLAPVAEILRRGWIKGSPDPTELARQMCEFMGIATIWDEPETLAALRASGSRGPQESAVLAWLKRVEHLATEQRLPAFDVGRLEQSLPEVLERSQTAAGVRELPGLLGLSGVHFLVVPHLPKSFLDGGSQWVDDRPVVAVTLRYDRIDSLWFTLMHEVAHILFGHRDLLAETLWGGDRDAPNEGEANRWAEEQLVPAEDYAVLTGRAVTRPTLADITAFARRIRRHPGIVVGRLQRDEILGYSQARSTLERVGPYLDGMVDQPTLLEGVS
jgi:HTH-type transcriptional regulator / antitoxin HigA